MTQHNWFYRSVPSAHVWCLGDDIVLKTWSAGRIGLTWWHTQLHCRWVFFFLFLHCLSTVHFHFPRYTKSELLVALVVLPWSWQPGWQLFCCPQRSSFGVIQYFLPPKLPTHHLTTFVHLLDQTFSIWYEIKQSQPQQGYCCVRHVMFSGSVSTI